MSLVYLGHRLENRTPFRHSVLWFHGNYVLLGQRCFVLIKSQLYHFKDTTDEIRYTYFAIANEDFCNIFFAEFLVLKYMK